MGVDVYELGGTGEAASGWARHAEPRGEFLYRGFLRPTVGGQDQPVLCAARHQGLRNGVRAEHGQHQGKGALGTEGHRRCEDMVEGEWIPVIDGVHEEAPRLVSIGIGCV
jgi:hypothetical protein